MTWLTITKHCSTVQPTAICQRKPSSSHFTPTIRLTTVILRFARRWIWDEILPAAGAVNVRLTIWWPNMKQATHAWYIQFLPPATSLTNRQKILLKHTIILDMMTLLCYIVASIGLIIQEE